MRRRIAIASLLAVALAAALFAGRSFAGLPGRPGVRWEARHIRIDEARLAAIDDVMDLIQPLWWTVNISSPEAYEASLAPFTRGQRLVYALQMYRLEVDNGGHGQFYGNSGGIVWRDALEGFELLGLRELADNLRARRRRSWAAIRPSTEVSGRRCSPSFGPTSQRSRSSSGSWRPSTTSMGRSWRTPGPTRRSSCSTAWCACPRQTP